MEKEVEMNNEPLALGKRENAESSQPDVAPGRQSYGVESIPPSISPRVNGTAASINHGDTNFEKSDSEAETVVLTGKDGHQEQNSRKTIKLEEASAEQSDVIAASGSVPMAKDSPSEETKENGIRKPSLKRKRITQEAGAVDMPDGTLSSNLSSTVSSPNQGAHSSKATETASDRSRSSPPFDDVPLHREGRIHKKRPRSNSSTDRKRRQIEGEANPSKGRKRRETRSATHFEEPTQRSESPPPRLNNRAQSTQSALPQSNGITKRRRAPAPLHVERRRKASEDTHPESDDSSSVHSHHRLQKLTSNDGNAMSPAKMVSHKKNRDKNGRTLLARACAQGVVEATGWLKERPEDIDVPDNAGNTPLQIAALEGDTEVVKLLLEAGCDIHCKNIDKDTPLIDAVENGHLEVVQMLLRAGLDPRQKNQLGKEPLELVPMDAEEADDIRVALLASKKEKESLRRPSEDHNRQHSVGSREVEASVGGTSGASPTDSTRSPPPPGARRRTARSQPTDDALLWVNATPARLRDAAGKGDLKIVDHILKMRPQADTESVLAAARGGHDEVLGFMLAIAETDPDPEPLRSGDYNLAYSTPMLAAIGRGNNKVINLLLDQRGFDPTRRLFKGLTYYEIAKERQGSEWEEEYDILKDAYDIYKMNGGRKSKNSSPRKVRAKRTDPIRSEPSDSLHDSRKARKFGTLKEDEHVDGEKVESLSKETSRRSLGAPRKQGSPTTASEKESDTPGPPNLRIEDGTAGNEIGPLEPERIDSLKPKRRLMSGNDFKTDQETKRRTSITTDADLPRRSLNDTKSNHEARDRRSSDASESAVKIKPQELPQVNNETGKKRYRTSISPQASKSEITESIDVAKKKKRRVDSQGNAADQDRDHSFRLRPAMVAPMIADPTRVTSPTIPQGTAPVAFMGTNVVSPITKSPTELQTHTALISPVNSIEQALDGRIEYDDVQVPKQVAIGLPHGKIIEHQGPRKATEEEDRRIAQIEVEKAQQLEAELEQKAQLEKEEAERKARVAREEEEAHLEAQRQAEEAEHQLQMERAEEEARVARKKRDEEMQKRRVEQERHRKEEQERKRRETEERESLRRLRLQEEEERIRRESLPNGLRRAAELSPEEARSAKEITKWLPLRTVTMQELDPDCDRQIAEETWIANLQAAPLLAVKDLDLSQYTAWHHFPATTNHYGSLWRQLRSPMSQAIPPGLLSPTEAYEFDQATRPKFFALKHVFWIKLADLMDIVPRHPHLNGLQLRTRAMALHDHPFGKGGTVERPVGGEGGVKLEAVSPVLGGNGNGNNMTNGVVYR